MPVTHSYTSRVSDFLLSRMKLGVAEFSLSILMQVTASANFFDGSLCAFFWNFWLQKSHQLVFYVFLRLRCIRQFDFNHYTSVGCNMDLLFWVQAREQALHAHWLLRLLTDQRVRILTCCIILGMVHVISVMMYTTGLEQLHFKITYKIKTQTPLWLFRSNVAIHGVLNRVPLDYREGF